MNIEYKTEIIIDNIANFILMQNQQHQHKHNHANIQPQQEKQKQPQKKSNKQQEKQQNNKIEPQNDGDQSDIYEYESQKMLDYFKNILKKHGSRQAQFLSYVAETSICSGIQSGEVFLAHEKGSLEKILFQSRVKQDKVNKEEEQEEKRRLAREMQLKYLSKQISVSKNRSKSKQAEQDNQFSELQQNNTVFSKKQHQQFLTKIIKQRSQLSLRKKQLEQRHKSKFQQQQKLRKIAQQQNQQKEREQRRKKILQKLQQQKVRHQQKAKEQQQNKKRLSQLKNKKFLHQRLQQKYNTEVLLPSLQEKKKKLKQIREYNKNFKIQQINNHQKQYLKKRDQLLSASNAKKVNEQWHYKIPQKSAKLAKLLEQQSIQAKLKLEQKKKRLQQRIQRQQQFANYLKEKCVPTIDPKKRQQIEQRLRLKSQSKQQKQKPDAKVLGINYLQQIKSQRKKSANSQLQLERRPIVMQQQQTQRKKSQTNYLNTRKDKRQYQQLRQKRIDRLINSETTDRSQKIMRLQVQANKLIQQQKRKQQKNKVMKSQKLPAQDDTQSTNLLLASIKAKMGIIDLYNKP